jgi:formate hydrogenlyase subunit 3/multisubunit Na+/H+ antiporter MnhD subunit
MDLSGVGKLLLGLGGLLLLIGALLVFGGRLPGISALGRLPGDIVIKRDNFSFYFPLTTSLLVSIILSLMLWLIFRR